MTNNKRKMGFNYHEPDEAEAKRKAYKEPIPKKTVDLDLVKLKSCIKS